MALFKPGPMVAQISGSIGGTTFSHNRGGTYARMRSIPTNPQSTYQTDVRTAMDLVSATWRTLTAAQQAAWAQYAIQNPTVNALGDKTTLTGHQAFVSLGTRLARAGDSLASLPPIDPMPVALTSLSVAAVSGAQSVTLDWTPTPIGSQQRIWTEACIVTSAGVHYVSNYYKQVDISAKNQATTYNIGANVVLRLGAIQAGHIIFVRCSVFSGLNGQISLPRLASCVVS